MIPLAVWAPAAQRVEVEARGARHAMTRDGRGWWRTEIAARGPLDYAFAVDGGSARPDPRSPWQPHGVDGPSRTVDHSAFRWTDHGWSAPPLASAVVYELHVGTFSPEGTFDGAIARLDALADLGVTHVEVMPVAEFPGARGWGYDGVYISAAHSAYGGPQGLAAFVDAAHAAGLAVLLDVVYNHVGASGAGALEAFGPYFTEKHHTAWGRAMNFDDADCDPVREWALQSAEQWVRDFHLDGLRLDAIHAIVDAGAEHLVAAVSRRVHDITPNAMVIAESGLNDPKVIRPPELGGWGCDAAWADDFHHALRVLTTGETEGWYGEFDSLGTLAKAMHRPHVHDGSYSEFRRRRFGAPAEDRPPQQFVVFAQNHDQVGNRAYGDRLPEPARRLAAFCTLLAPFTPMLFMGEEHGEPAPFQFFSDHIDVEIAEATREGRREEFAAFAAFGEDVPDPQDPETFERSKLTRQGDPELRDLYRRLLELRHELPHGEATDIAYDEHSGWLSARRGPYRLVTNFADARVHVPCEEPGEIVLATHRPTVEPGYLVLGPLSGAVIR
jgi:maltooligosyltrehalose trehalohydrolase